MNEVRMAKKLKTQSRADDKQLSEAVRNSAQQIWQAGLGAFAKAQEEGGKAFSRLVKDGSELQKRTQHFAEEKVSDVSGKVSKIAENVSKKAADSWDKLEQVFEDRVARSLISLGVPRQEDIQALHKRIEELNKTIASLSRKRAAVKSASAVKPAKSAKSTPKPAVKKAPAKKVAAKTSPSKKTPRKPAVK
jgi:poly(hydroxyalkanoate) granule-associated protein